MPTGLETDLGLECPVELDRVHHHLREAEGASELPDEPGRVEGRPARQVGALAQDDVLPAEAREPVEDGGTADASADDDRAGARLHARSAARAERRQDPPRSAPSARVLGGVGGEVKLERRDPLLHDSPHGFAEVRHEAHQDQGRAGLLIDLAEIGREQFPVLFVAELVIDGEVGQIEEAIAHARVLPVDDADALPVVDEIRVQQVVVAGSGTFALPRSLDCIRGFLRR